jgi:hypothetical protein
VQCRPRRYTNSKCQPVARRVIKLKHYCEHRPVGSRAGLVYIDPRWGPRQSVVEAAVAGQGSESAAHGRARTAFPRTGPGGVITIPYLASEIPTVVGDISSKLIETFDFPGNQPEGKEADFLTVLQLINRAGGGVASLRTEPMREELAIIEGGMTSWPCKGPGKPWLLSIKRRRCW